jgi:hypothetical protein
MNDIHKKTDIKNINFDKYFGCKKLDVIFLWNFSNKIW